jgi:hypothetical protein
MSSQAQPAMSHYDETYYTQGCGPVPYQDRAVWGARFRFVAQKIKSEIAPATVFDAGCAFGYLIETLREQGIDTWGSDVSTYAIDQAGPAAKPFVHVASITDPLTRRYDLITCIEVLEHVDAATGDAAIANFCAHSDAVLFSSSPDDFDEPTQHVNVQPPAYWAERFAAHGFFRDLAVDTRWLTSWSALFRKRPRDDQRLLQDYENTLVDTRTRADKAQSASDALIGSLTSERAALAHERHLLLLERDALRAERNTLRETVRGYENGRVMRLMRAVHSALRGGAK